MPSTKQLSAIENAWIDATMEEDGVDWKALAKLLRALTAHVKTPEGIPKEFQDNVREKVQYIVNGLPEMGTKALVQCISATDYARKQLDSDVSYGGGLAKQLTPDERKKLRDRSKPLNLRPTSFK